MSKYNDIYVKMWWGNPFFCMPTEKKGDKNKICTVK